MSSNIKWYQDNIFLGQSHAETTDDLNLLSRK